MFALRAFHLQPHGAQSCTGVRHRWSRHSDIRMTRRSKETMHMQKSRVLSWLHSAPSGGPRPGKASAASQTVAPPEETHA